MGEEGKWGGKGETAWYKGSCPANDGGLNYFWNFESCMHVLHVLCEVYAATSFGAAWKGRECVTRVAVVHPSCTSRAIVVQAEVSWGVHMWTRATHTYVKMRYLFLYTYVMCIFPFPFIFINIYSHKIIVRAYSQSSSQEPASQLTLGQLTLTRAYR